MKNPVFLFCAILVAWITMSCLLYDEKCCTSKVNTLTTTKPPRKYFHGIILVDKDSVIFRVNNNFIFYRASIGYLPPMADSLKLWVQTTSEYLKQNNNKKLKLICRYNPSESSKNNQVDYGILRAKEIEKLFIENGIPQNQLITVGLRDSLLPFKNNRIYGGFIPLIINE